MKILLITPCDLPVPAVCGGAVASLMESILKENEKKKKLDITVVSSWNEKAERKSAEYRHSQFIWLKINSLCKMADNLAGKIFKLLGKSGKDYIRKLYVISKIKKILSENDYDAVVVQNSGYLLKAFREKSLAEKYKDKIYYHLHNDIPVNADDEVLKHVKFILISRYLMKNVALKCGKDAEKRCCIVKNGINCQKFRKELSSEEELEIRNKLSISSDKKIIVFVGRIVEYKGIREVLEAISEMNDKSVVLLIIGSTNFGASDKSEFEASIQKKCEELGEQVRFTGFIHNDEVWKYYKLGDMAVLPSTWQEPAGLTMIEAASAGLPVVTTNSGGIPEYLNSEHAIFLDVNAELTKNIKASVEKILSDELEWKKTGMKASEYVMGNFSESAFYDSFTDALNGNC